MKTHFTKTTSYVSFFFIAAIFLGEFLLFKNYLHREITPYYPAHFDQTTFLLISYTFYENSKLHGLIYAFSHTELLATGMLFPLQAALSYFLFGVSRFSALLPNLFYFLMLQATLFFTVKSITQKLHLAWIAMGLLLCLQVPFITYGGGLSDFRMDFIAFCLYGIFICVVMQSHIFLKRNVSLLAVGIAIWLVLFRTLTAVYFILLIITLLIWFTKIKDRTRLKNVFLMAIVFLLGIFPYLWMNKETLYGYYVFNHVIGNDKMIRAMEVGATTFFSSLFFYPHSVFKNHIGTLGYGTFIFLLGSYFLIAKCRLQKKFFLTPENIFLFLSFLIPLIVLTLDTSKSFVVGSILVMPIVWFLIRIISSLEENILYKKILPVIAIIIFSIGIFNQYHSYQHKNKEDYYRSLLAINHLYQDIGDYAVRYHHDAIHLSFDHIMDYFTPQGMTVWYYENNKKLLKIDARLGNAIFAIDKKTALKKIKGSDLVILRKEYDDDAFFYPFNQSMCQLKKLIWNDTEKHFKPCKEYIFFKGHFVLFCSKK